MTLKTRVVGLLQYAQGDDVQTYLQRWLAQSLRSTDGLFDPVSGHNHNGAGNNGPVVAGGGGVTMVWRGAWSSATAYAKNDGVSYLGSSYIALASVGPTSTTPDTDPTHWGVLAQGGSPGAPGTPGAVGPAGPQGVQGPPGAANAIYTREWTWNNQTAVPPNTSQLRSNTGDWATATVLNVHNQDNSNVDRSAALREIASGMQVRLQHKTDATRWALFDVTGASVAQSGYFSVPVTFNSGGGTLPNSGTAILVSVLSTGLTAAQWYTGAGAPASTLGKVGDMYLQSNGTVWQDADPGGWATTGTNIMGPTGATGPQGPAGQGVPTGGTAGQMLTKIDATNYNTNWTTPSSGLTLPLGQNLTFNPDNTYDVGASAANRPRNVYVAGAVVERTKAGVPTDADVVGPADGMMIVDTTDKRLYVRVGGLWLYTALGTPPTQAWGSP